MVILFCIKTILAIELPSLRISPLLFRIAAIVFVCAAALLLSVVYIQSIGSGTANYSGLFNIANIYDINISLFSLVPFKPVEFKKPRRLTEIQKSQFILQEEMKQILVGLLLGFGYNNPTLRQKGLVVKPKLVNL